MSRKRNHPSEKEVQREILDYCRALPNVAVWRANTGAMSVAGRFVRFGVKGQADLTGIIPGGRRVEIEVKSKTGKQSLEQKLYQEIIERYGGLYILANCVEDVISGLKNFL